MKLNRVGEKYKTKEGYEVVITEYFNGSNCTVEFENGVIFKNVQHHNIKSGEIKNPYHSSVYGVGYLGQGEYKTKKDNKPTKVYSTWISMLRRCYSKKYQEKQPTYKGCAIDEHWYSFQNFAEWFYQTYTDNFQLDKDILVKNNRIYSPETCCFVPQEINILFTKSKSDLPIGITYYRNKFQAQITRNNELVYLGAFATLEEAFQVYKTAKEAHIKEVANRWKDKIDTRVYEAMYNYQVEIID